MAIKTFESKLASLKRHQFIRSEAKRLRVTIPQFLLLESCPDADRRLKLLARATPKKRRKSEKSMNPVTANSRWSLADIIFMTEILIQRRDLETAGSRLKIYARVITRFRDMREKITGKRK